MDKSDLQKAAAVARSLDGSTRETEEQLRDRAVAKFFGEQGIPPHLKNGWAVLETNRKHRAEVGYPLPPGGCLTTGYESVVAGAMAEVHSHLARVLVLDAKFIKLGLRRDSRGKMQLEAKIVDPPDNWVVPAVQTARDYDEAVRQHVARAVGVLNGHFQNTVAERLGVYAFRRVDVDQEVAPVRER